MLCRRCGYPDDGGHISKRVERGQDQLCASCAAQPAKTVKSDYGICRPWDGEFDQDDNPVDNQGNLYRPGVRLCGNSDCVAKKHIEEMGVIAALTDEQIQALEAERLGISYRTGIKLSWKQIVAKVTREGNRGRNHHPRSGN